MFSYLRQLYWRVKYRPGRKVTFCFLLDGFNEILVVENRLATTGTLLYRERGINVFGSEQEEFGPIREDTVPDIVRRLTTFPSGSALLPGGAAYREFKLRVPIGEISNEEGEIPAIRSLFSLLSVTPPQESLETLYDSFYDYSAARHVSDPSARTGRGDVLIFISDTDENSFIAIDMFNEATDQTNTVEIGICAEESCAAEIATLLKSIRLSAEVATAFLQGDLGIRKAFSRDSFPRLVPNHHSEVVQHAQFFRGGKLIYATQAPCHRSDK